MAELIKNLREYIENLENTVREQKELIEKLQDSKIQDQSTEVTEIYTDGSSLGNPGHGGSAFVVKNGKSSQFYMGDNVTNNECEYAAVEYAVEFCRTSDLQKVRMYTDSNLVVQQLRGHWKVNCEKLRRYKDSIIEITRGFELFDIQHVAGHMGNRWNEIADKLAKEAAEKRKSTLF